MEWSAGLGDLHRRSAGGGGVNLQRLQFITTLEGQMGDLVFICFYEVVWHVKGIIVLLVTGNQGVNATICVLLPLELECSADLALKKGFNFSIFFCWRKNASAHVLY